MAQEHPLKVLLLGDASNYNASLAVGLRRLGHDVTLASDGGRWMDTSRDVDLSRRDGKIGGAILWMKICTTLASKFKGYDVVQLSNPVFVHQRPCRVEKLFDRLRRDNRSVFLTALGIDKPYLDLCLDPRGKLRYSEWRMPDGSETDYAKESGDVNRAWHSHPLEPLNDKVYREVDGVVSALYEYDVACRRVLEPERLAYGGIAIDTESLTPEERPSAGKIRMLLGRHRDRIHEKGTDVLERMGREIVDSRPDAFELDVVENLPYDEYVERLRRADIVMDQLYSYTPATNALLAMARGQIAVSGGEEAYYDFIGEKDLRPIVNAVPGDENAAVELIKSLAADRQRLIEMGRQGRALVERHNAAEIVAQRFVDFWLKRLEEKNR